MNSNRRGKPRRKGPRRSRATQPAAPSDDAIFYPPQVQARYKISAVTRWRWEREGKLPARDVFHGGVPEGWRKETLLAAEQRPAG